MGTTIESDWENTRLLEELEAARADIENVQLVSQLHYDANLSLRQQLAAEQANNVRLRKFLSSFRDDVLFRIGSRSMYRNLVVEPYYERIKTILATPSDTSGLESYVVKAGEKMRDRCINVAWNNEPDCNGPIEMGIRDLPAVTLEDLK